MLHFCNTNTGNQQKQSQVQYKHDTPVAKDAVLCYNNHSTSRGKEMKKSLHGDNISGQTLDDELIELEYRFNVLMW